MRTATHRWKLEREALARKGPNITVEIANQATSRESGFKKTSGVILIDTGAYRTGVNEAVLLGIGAKETGQVRVRVVGKDEEKRPIVTCYLRFVDHGDDSSAIWESDCKIEVVSLTKQHAGFGILGRDLLHCCRLTYNGTTGEVELALSEE